MKFSNKMGTIVDILLPPLFVIIIALVILLIGLLAFISRIGETTTFEKNFLATDLALTLETIQAGRANSVVLFTQGQNFSFDFSKNTVEVFEGEKKRDKTRGIYYFTEDADLNILYKTLEAEERIIFSITIARQGNDIVIDSKIVNPEFTLNLEAIGCIDAAHTPLAAIAIDYDRSIEPGLARSISVNLGASLGISGTAIKEQGLSVKERKERIRGSDGAVLIRAISGRNNELGNIKAYIDFNSPKKEESRLLACRILNELSGRFKATGSAIVPVDLRHHYADDYRQVLNQEQLVGVALDIGSVNPEKELQIVNAISNGIEKYQTG